MTLGLTMCVSSAFTSPSSLQPSTAGIFSSKISLRLRLASGAKVDILVTRQTQSAANLCEEFIEDGKRLLAVKKWHFSQFVVPGSVVGT